MVSWFYQYYYLCASIGRGHGHGRRGDLAQFSKNQKPFLRTTPTLNIWEAGAGGVDGWVDSNPGTYWMSGENPNAAPPLAPWFDQ